MPAGLDTAVSGAFADITSFVVGLVPVFLGIVALGVGIAVAARLIRKGKTAGS